MGKVISLSARLNRPKGESASVPPMRTLDERVALLEKNMWTIVEYVDEMEERLSSVERHFRKLLRLLQETP